MGCCDIGTPDKASWYLRSCPHACASAKCVRHLSRGLNCRQVYTADHNGEWHEDPG
jgi:hypothetical protein